MNTATLRDLVHEIAEQLSPGATWDELRHQIELRASIAHGVPCASRDGVDGLCPPGGSTLRAVRCPRWRRCVIFNRGIGHGHRPRASTRGIDPGLHPGLPKCRTFSPVGSIPHVLFVEVDAVSLEEHAVLAAEIGKSMMLSLILDVPVDALDVGRRDGKHAVARLPRERCQPVVA